MNPLPRVSAAYARSWRPTPRSILTIVLLFGGLALVVLAVLDGRHRDAGCGGCVHYDVSIPVLVVGGAIALFGAALFDPAALAAWLSATTTIIREVRTGRRESDVRAEVIEVPKGTLPADGIVPAGPPPATPHREPDD